MVVLLCVLLTRVATLFFSVHRPDIIQEAKDGTQKQEDGPERGRARGASKAERACVCVYVRVCVSLASS